MWMQFIIVFDFLPLNYGIYIFSCIPINTFTYISNLIFSSDIFLLRLINGNLLNFKFNLPVFFLFLLLLLSFSLLYILYLTVFLFALTLRCCCSTTFFYLIILCWNEIGWSDVDPMYVFPVSLFSVQHSF